MQTISLCMIVRDEEAVLARCLSSVADLVDEIIIVDTGSQDSTKEVAAQYTDAIYDFVWRDDFAAARNFSFAKATMDYCLWLDADDRLTEENRQKFWNLKENLDSTADMIFLPYTNWEETGRNRLVYCRERLLRRKAGFCWQGRVHEAIEPAGNIQYGDATITHCPLKKEMSARNLRIYETILKEGQHLEPRDQYYYGRELYSHQRFAEAAEVFSRFLQEADGWAVNQVDACRLLANCYQQLEQTEKVLPALLQALAYEAPDAGICCDLGNYFLQQQHLEQALYWYEQALQCKLQPDSGKFVQQDDYDYIPHLQLCVCYDRLGQWERAEQHNELAAFARPNSEEVAYNRQYFQRRRQLITAEA